MNNGRDCPHGRQVGKCDTCDIIKTKLDLLQVTAERDALKFFCAGFYQVAASFDASVEHLDSLVAAANCDDSFMKGVFISAPSVQVYGSYIDAAKAGFSAGWERGRDHLNGIGSDLSYINHVDQYVAQLRAKVGAA